MNLQGRLNCNPSHFHQFFLMYRIMLISLVCQVSTWFFTTFSVSGMKQKVHHVETLQQLFTCILPEQIDIPPFVLEYDARVRPYTHHSLCLVYQPCWPTSAGLHTHTHTLSHALSCGYIPTLYQIISVACVCYGLKCNMYLQTIFVGLFKGPNCLQNEK